ncbi:MAG: hypothetical protein SGILL_003531 [Bacillariaceae sp.]
MEDARKFLWEDDETGGGSDGRTSIYGRTSIAVDQSVNLHDVSGGGSGGGAVSTGSRLSSTITGLFRGTAAGSTSLSGGPRGSGSGSTGASRFEDYGDAAPSADAEEYISDKRRRLSPVWAAFVNAANSVKIALERFGIHGTKLLLCLLVGFGLLGGGLYIALSSPDSSGKTAAAGGEVVNNDSVRYNNIKKRIVEANLTPKAALEAASSSPQSLALQWIAKQDPAQVKVDHPALLDRYSLAVFYFMSQNASNEEWTQADGWLTGSGFCSWYGIECIPREQEATEENEFNPFTGTYDDNDRVTGIVLNANNIEAEIPEEWGIALDRLVTLNLKENRLSHTLPSTLGKLQNLRSLLLADNKLIGKLSSELGALSNLHQLDLSRNSFEGPLSPSWSNMKELRDLALSNNLLTGSLPEYLAEMTKLIGLFLSDNDFEGDLSFVEKLTDLSKCSMHVGYVNI